MENIKRNHITTIFDDVLTSFKAWLIPFLIIIFSKSGKDGTGFITRYLGTAGIKLAIVLFIAVLIIVFSFVKWYRKTYEMTEGFIVVNEGVLVRKRRQIPVNKIQTLNISQNIIQKLFNTAALKIDTGNSNMNNAEVSIIVRKNEAEHLKESLSGITQAAGNEAVSQPTEEKASSGEPAAKKAEVVSGYTVTMKELAVAGLTSNGLFAGIAFLLSAYALLDDVANFIGDRVGSLFMPYLENYNFQTMRITEIITFVLIIIVIYLVLSSIASVIGSIIKYYGFTVKRQDNKLLIRYGLFNTRNYILPVEKVKVVHVKQSFLRQLSGIAALHVESVGYGNEKGEASIIYPVAGKAKAEEILKKLLPEFKFGRELMKVPRRSLRRFILSAVLFPLILCIAASLIFRSYGYFSFIILPFFALKGVLEYRNSASARDGSVLCISSRAFTKTVTFLKMEGVQSVTHSSNFFQRRKALFNYIVSIQSNYFGSNVKVKNLDENMKSELMDI